VGNGWNWCGQRRNYPYVYPQKTVASNIPEWTQENKKAPTPLGSKGFDAVDVDL
jgi:hypothetical protein